MRRDSLNSKHVLILGGVLALCMLYPLQGNAAARTGLRFVDVDGAPHVPVASLLSHYGFEQARHEAGHWVLHRGQETLELSLNSRRARWNGVLIWLHEPVVPYRRDGAIAAADVRAVLGPLLRPADVLAGVGRKRVLIDPGHGGRDEGARGSLGSREKDLTLTIATGVADRLRAAGVDVFFTRDTDVHVSLADRVQGMVDGEADLFVSIHFNAAANTAAQGVETFVLAAGGHRNTADQGEGPFAPEREANAFDGANQVLAYCVQRRMLEQTGSEDRGVRRARFYVLREATVPAILLEGGFLSHPPEERNLLRPAHQRALAGGIAQGIIDYLAAVARAELELTP